MKKNMYIYPVSVLLAVGLLAGAAMPVQAASGRTVSAANPKASPEPEVLIVSPDLASSRRASRSHTTPTSTPSWWMWRTDTTLMM